MNEIPENVQEKIRKIYALTQRGATEGEKAAANRALEAVMAKYKIPQEEWYSMLRPTRIFTYRSELEKQLMCLLNDFLFGDKMEIFQVN